MAGWLMLRGSAGAKRGISRSSRPCISIRSALYARSFQTNTKAGITPDYAFAFDIDGVLVRSSHALHMAHETLVYLQSRRIPFILLTNGGGKKEVERCEQLSELLGVRLNASMIVQSHTPLRGLAESLADRQVLVIGGDGPKCRLVAEDYGFRNVLIPGDLLVKYPELWPFGDPTRYKPYALSLAKVQSDRNFTGQRSKYAIKIDAMMVFNDPRDWALDIQIILDLLLSHQGYLGSRSPRNGERDLPNRGYQRDGQPPLYFSNPDLLWAAGYHLPRLGQGGFRAALEGVWSAVTGGQEMGVQLEKTMIGKPYKETFDYAEDMLLKHREHLLESQPGAPSLKNVFMVGDNPESDILGANQYGTPVSPRGIRWRSILVRSGVYNAGEKPAHEPETIAEDVWHAVQWATEHADPQAK